ncbi:MAG: hypothetical protein KAY50_00420 [Chitinophagaceae bacterium]|nr:hypothetical protein [Chitinophagaceae bacterium]
MKYTRQERYDIYYKVHEAFLVNQATFICHEIGKVLSGNINGMDENDFPELKFVAPRRFSRELGRSEWIGAAFCVNDEEPCFEHMSDQAVLEYNQAFKDLDNFICAAENQNLWKVTMLEFMMELCVQDDLDEWTP